MGYTAEYSGVLWQIPMNRIDEAIMKQTLIFLFTIFILAGCGQAELAITLAPTVIVTAPMPTAIPKPSVTTSIISELSAYAFPASIDPSKQYLFYLHGKIIEDQGVHAVSPDFGEYEYEAILKKLSDYDFIVISEQRPKNTDGAEYAKKVVKQVTALLKYGVPAANITVVGASKGAGIAIDVSHLLENEEINFVIMGICNPDEVDFLKQNQTNLYGNILSIYDSVDELAGSCQEIFALSEGRGLARHDEIVLHVGTGHGILYKPLDEWIVPAVEWAN
jgi:hypothetical protein